MPWHTPRTWIVNELVTPNLFNQQIRDNMLMLKARADAQMPFDYAFSKNVPFTTTSTSFVEVSAGTFTLDINSNGGAMMVGFSCGLSHTVVGGEIKIDIQHTIGGVSYNLGGTQGCVVVQATAANRIHPAHYTQIIGGGPGPHTLKLMIAQTGGTASVVDAVPVSFYVYRLGLVS